MARRAAVHDMITSKRAPKPVGPYTHAVRVKQAGAMLFVSGQLPIELPSGELCQGPMKRQADLALTHMRNIVADGGFTMDEIVKVTIYLTDLKHFDVVNDLYAKMFIGQTLPARAVVQVAALPKGAGIEVECIAVKQSTQPSADDLLDFADG